MEKFCDFSTLKPSDFRSYGQLLSLFSLTLLQFRAKVMFILRKQRTLIKFRDRERVIAKKGLFNHEKKYLTLTKIKHFKIKVSLYTRKL